MRARPKRRMLLIPLAFSLGCGVGAQPIGVGMSHGQPAPTAVELELRTPEGEYLDVGDLRGAPVLLFLFATFDAVSQAGLVPLRRFMRHDAGVRVVGIAVQPDAAMLVDAWGAALTPPFPLTFDPNGVITRGTSALGPVDTVPTYVLLDARGVIVDRHVGFADERELMRMVEPVLTGSARQTDRGAQD